MSKSSGASTEAAKRRKVLRNRWLMGELGVGFWVTSNKYTKPRVKELFSSPVVRRATAADIRRYA